jgi:hypothetical protein
MNIFTNSPVSPSQRWTPDHPCPVCGGHPNLRPKRGVRCHGFRSADGRFARCAREERAGMLTIGADGLFGHKLGDGGECVVVLRWKGARADPICQEAEIACKAPVTTIRKAIPQDVEG